MKTQSVSMMGFPLLYLFGNTYTGETKWLPLEEGNALGGYWELDSNQKPIPIYPDDWV